VSRPGLELLEPHVDDAVQLSVVIPCYNEARRLPESLTRVLVYCDGIGKPYEVILIDDGSTDHTLCYMSQAGRRCPAIKVVGFRSNGGKGRAVAEGVRVSTGASVLFTDADLSTPIEEVVKLQRALEAGADVAFASRAAPGARELNRVAYRRVMGRLFNLLVQAFLLPGFRDTQCGFKLFRGTVARELFANLQTDGFAFDVEVLLRARRAGYRVEEVPVHWVDSDSTTVSPVRHALQMVRDVLRLCLMGA